MWVNILEEIGVVADLECEDGLVAVGEVGIHGHDHTVGYDRQDDQVLERGPAHKPDKHPPRVEQSVSQLVSQSINQSGQSVSQSVSE